MTQVMLSVRKKLLGGHVKFDAALIRMDDLITYFKVLIPKKPCSFEEISIVWYSAQQIGAY